MKRCNKCSEVKPLAEFYRDKGSPDGHRWYCKTCFGAQVKARREANPDQKKAVDRAWKDQHPEQVRAYRRGWVLRHRNEKAEQNKKYRGQNPEKDAAHQSLNYAVRTGRLIKPKACERCGENERIQGHHEDYSQPLQVIWLCRPCHAKRHAEHT